MNTCSIPVVNYITVGTSHYTTQFTEQMTTDYTPGDEWESYYRGYRLRANPDEEIWWQAYQGTDRLLLEPIPDDLVETLLELKHLGGRIRITEGNDVISRIEAGDDSYETVWVGEMSLAGEFVPPEDPEFSIQVAPDDVAAGELWPSVYDGAKYSFGPGGDRVWWANPSTSKRHPLQTSLPSDVKASLTRYKPRGGSFRVTPWNDVLTLVDLDKLPSGARTEFDNLPRVVKNLISLRKERGGVQKIPIYVGEIDETPLTVGSPPSLTDPVSSAELGLDGWTDSLGATKTTEPDDHSVGTADGESTDDNTADDSPPGSDSAVDETELPDDDPIDW